MADGLRWTPLVGCPFLLLLLLLPLEPEGLGTEDAANTLVHKNRDSPTGRAVLRNQQMPWQ